MDKYEGYTPNTTTVMEMSDDGSSGNIDVPVDAQLLEQVKQGDEDPMFVTIEVLNESVSKNGRNWSKEAIASVAEQINSKRPDGYMGHLLEGERKHKYPKPQTIWLGAKAEETDGKMRLFAKGYVLPEAKRLRTYLRKAKAAGKSVAVSVYGTIERAAKAANGALEMANFDLESIDWARPGSEGVKNTGQFMIAAEMADDSKGKGVNKEEDVNREDVLKSATASELQEHNPEVVSEMTNEAASQKEAEQAEVVQEMADIKAELGLDDNSEKSAKQVVQEMKEQQTQHELDAQLQEKVDSPAARKLIRHYVVSEMQEGETVSQTVDRVLASETGKEVIQEMVDTAPTVQPQTQKPAGEARKFTKKKE